MTQTIAIIQVVLSVLIIVTILLQQNGASLGSAFGGDNWSSAIHTRRGFEKFLYFTSIILSILFVATALWALLVS